MKYSFSVNGMSCGGCVKSIQNAVKKADPESQVEVSLEKKTVEVETRIEEKRIREAIFLAGFEITGK